MMLGGKTALVTGAGRGIGSSIATVMARHGADIVLASRSIEGMEKVADEIRGMGRRARVTYLDLLDPATVETMRDEALEAFGRIDALVCNSGVGGPSAPLWAVGEAEWDETMAVNVTGTWRCCKAMIPPMIEAGGGSIVVIGSMSGKRPLLHRSPYTTSKTALIGFVRTLALDAGPHGIRVNMVSPGPVEGPRLEWVIEAQAEAKGISVDEARIELAAQSPLNRFVGPEHVAEAVAFLASDVSAATTGEDVNVSAGVCMW
jgi:NAD(P)-dependent dehydrogenase (short-subunit alcohol dehydrogenase family)